MIGADNMCKSFSKVWIAYIDMYLLHFALTDSSVYFWLYDKSLKLLTHSIMFFV